MKKIPTLYDSQNNKHTGKKGYSSLQESSIKSLQNQTHQKKKKRFFNDHQSPTGKRPKFYKF